MCGNRLIPAVIHEWREPCQREFEQSDVHSVTEALKDGNLAELPKRTKALHGLLDVPWGSTDCGWFSKISVPLHVGRSSFSCYPKSTDHNLRSNRHREKTARAERIIVACKRLEPAMFKP